MKKKIFIDLALIIIIACTLLFIDIPYVDLPLCFIAIVIYSWQQKELKSGLGFSRPKNWAKLIAVSIALAAAIVLISYLLLLPVIEQLTKQPLRIGIFEQIRGNLSLLFTSLILGWFVGGLFEETIFRGFLLNKIKNLFPGKLGLGLGVILSSTFFGYLHIYQGVTGQLLVGFVGLLLAIIYLVNRQNIWLNIFTHGFVNTLSMLMLYFEIFEIG